MGDLEHLVLFGGVEDGPGKKVVLPVLSDVAGEDHFKIFVNELETDGPVVV